MQYVLDCVTMILTSILCFLMLYRKFDIRKDHLILRITGVVLINAIKIGTLLLSVPILNLTTTCLICFSMVGLIYKCSVKTTIIYSLIFIMIALVSDVLDVLIVSRFYENTITETIGASSLVWHRHIWNWIFMIILSRITAMFIKQNYNIRTKWYEMAFYLFMLGFEVAFFIAVSNAIQDYMSGQFLIFIMSGFVVLDMGVIFILRKISLLRDTEQQLLLMKQQENLQLQMYSELNKKYDSAREISHDINRHITSLEALIKAEHNEQAERYFSDLSKAADRLNPVIKNQNSMLAIILNTVSDRCIKDDIRLDLNVEDFSLGFISDIDMTTIFSNLLDNAIDACLELSKSRRYISFVLKKQIGLIVVNIINPCDDNAEVSDKRSSKEKHSGIGLMNVRKAVDKYDGVFSLNKSNGEFCVSITFNENRRKNAN